MRPCHSTGDVLTYTRLPWSEPPAPSYVDLLYEDEHMVGQYGTVPYPPRPHGLCLRQYLTCVSHF